MRVYHDSRSLHFREPAGALEEGSVLRLRLEADGAEEAVLRLWSDLDGETRIPMDRTEGGFVATCQMPSEAQLIWYYFIVTDREGRMWYYGNAADRLGGEGALSEHEPPSFQVTVYRRSKAPDWFKNALVYQIFPDSFRRGEDFEERKAAGLLPEGWQGPERRIRDDWMEAPGYQKKENGDITCWSFYGGTIGGVREKLDYLRSLGVTAIYFNPIFRAASCHRYDTADYLTIDPLFGDNDSFRAFVEEAKKKGISVILDGVFSHTGADSIYFDKYGNFGGGACSDEHSPYLSWYHFDPDLPNGYASWWGVADLPEVDELDPSYEEFICGKDGVISRWFDCGIKGFRLDVADELPDAFIRDLRKAVRGKDPDGLLLGEVWEDASNKISYGEKRRFLLGDELDGVMNYPLRHLLLEFACGRITSDQVQREVLALMENYPRESFYASLNLIGGHDRMRALSLLGGMSKEMSEEEQRNYQLSGHDYYVGRERLKMLSSVLYAYPGVPCLYYGDEAGMQGGADPYNRGPYPWGAEDENLKYHYRMLGLHYREHSAFKDGDYIPLNNGDPDILAFLRKNAQERILVVANRNVDKSREYACECATAGYALDLLNSEELPITDGKLYLTVAPMTTRMILLQEEPPKVYDMGKKAGVICALSSIPETPLGEGGRTFVDYLAASGMKLWQILPLNPAGIGDSPYFSPAVFAGDPAYIDRVALPSLEGYEEFCRDNQYWLHEYALYHVLCGHFQEIDWRKWPEEASMRTGLGQYEQLLSAQIEEAKKDQYYFFTQWNALRDYAHAKGISIIGDIPIYVAPYGMDTWATREEFQIDAKGGLTCRAGVAPDYFSKEGQDWGNPLYDWEHMRGNGYHWWTQRLKNCMKLYDYIRLDHFRSFSAYYSIPAGKSAKEGNWIPGEGMAFLNAIRSSLGNLKLIAEDLGNLDDAVFDLLKLAGLPGMDIWQFTAKQMQEMTEEKIRRRIFYTGTHDNQMLVAWCRQQLEEQGKEAESAEEMATCIIEELYASKAPWVILPLQDMLLLGDEARLNKPGTVFGNWKWQYDPAALTETIARRFHLLAEQNGRLKE